LVVKRGRDGARLICGEATSERKVSAWRFRALEESRIFVDAEERARGRKEGKSQRPASS
jgi:hypothetical protein